MVDQEMLAAVSSMLESTMMKQLEQFEERVDAKFEQFEKRMDTKLEQRLAPLEKEVRKNSLILENEVLPRLQTIEQCYVESSRIFMQKAEQIDKMQEDIDVMKLVIQEHSRKLEMIS